MDSLRAAQIVEVSAGKLESLTLEHEVWQLAFEKGLIVGSHAGWRLYEHDFGAKLQIGSRDLMRAENPLQTTKEVIGEAVCEMISFNAVGNSTQLELLRGNDRLSLQLLANSAANPRSFA